MSHDCTSVYLFIKLLAVGHTVTLASSAMKYLLQISYLLSIFLMLERTKNTENKLLSEILFL